MSDAATTRRSYDAVASRYAVEIGEELASKPLDRALLAAVVELADGRPVGDLACGPGHVAAHLAAAGADVLALDLSPRMCAITAGRGRTARVCAGDLTALPLRSNTLGAVVCMYAVIHLDTAQRALAYREFSRVLVPGGHALVAFHVSDPEHDSDTTSTVSDWWGHDVDLDFRFLDPERKAATLDAAGLTMVAHLDRRPLPGAEHPSKRSYLLVRNG